MSEQATVGAKKPKGRSPLYPAINLETAIQRARQIYEKERRHATPVTTIVAHWKYSSLNGPAAQALAALKKYGLMEDEGAGQDRKAKLSALAEVILVHPDEDSRKDAVQEAALMPTLHRELWERYHLELPSDSNLHWELTHDRGFTETGATEFIRVYRATIAFAQLGSRVAESTPADDEDVERYDGDIDGDSPPDHHAKERRREVRGATRSYPIPLIGGGVVVVEGAFPITEQDWTQFMAVLAAMKPGLVAVSPDEGS